MIGTRGSGRRSNPEDKGLLDALRRAVGRREDKNVKAAEERARGLARLRREGPDKRDGEA